MQPGRYALTRDILSVGGDYTLKDAAGATVMTFDGKLRFAATFTALDAQGRALFTGKEHVLDLDQHFEFQCDGVPFATMDREWVGKIRLLGSQDFRYVVACRTGERLTTSGYVVTNWTLKRDGNAVMRIDRNQHDHDIELLDARDAHFLMTVVMAVSRLNPPPRVANRPD